MNLQHTQDVQTSGHIDLAAHAGCADRIDVTDPQAVEDWSRQWGVSEFDLRCAVAAAGVEAADVRSHLGLR